MSLLNAWRTRLDGKMKREAMIEAVARVEHFLEHVPKDLLEIEPEDVRQYVWDLAGDDPRDAMEAVLQLVQVSRFFEFIRSEGLRPDNPVFTYRLEFHERMLRKLNELDEKVGIKTLHTDEMEGVRIDFIGNPDSLRWARRQ